MFRRSSLDDEDRARYRQLLREALLGSGCQRYAYVLIEICP
jgi:hypothetical protein